MKQERVIESLLRECESARRQAAQMFKVRRTIRSRSERRIFVRDAIARVRALNAALAVLHQSEVEAASKGSLWERLREHKRCEIALALLRNGFNRTHTARELQMCRRALINNIAELGLQTRRAVREAARLV